MTDQSISKSRSNERPSDERLDRIRPEAILSLYRYADPFPDGFRDEWGSLWKPGTGYKPEDRIGHAVISTVRGLAFEVQRLREAAGRVRRDIEEVVETAWVARCAAA